LVASLLFLTVTTTSMLPPSTPPVSFRIGPLRFGPYGIPPMVTPWATFLPLEFPPPTRLEIPLPPLKLPQPTRQRGRRPQGEWATAPSL
jgi:hypothetical protein